MAWKDLDIRKNLDVSKDLDISRNTLISAGAVTAVFLTASILARKGVGKSWYAVADSKPPPEKSNSEIDVKEAVAWGVVSGAAVGLARVAVRRYLSRVAAKR